MRVLIAGSAGFIGSHLCEYFLEKGHKVIGVDNFITGSKKNISNIKNKNFSFIEHDVIQSLNFRGKLDAILHFASPASPFDYLDHPFETLKAGSIATHNLLDLAEKKKAIFLLASTSEVYGDPKEHPQKESYWGNVNPIGERSVYDEAKRYAEAVTMAYHRYKSVSVRIVRIFNTYGERMRPNDGRAIPNFISQALRNKPMTIFGDGRQTRSFCYVKDLVDGIYKLLLSTEQMPVNIGNPTELTLKELAIRIQKITNTKNKLVYKPLPKDDPKVRKPDISRAKKILKWSPKVNVDDGLKKTVDYFKTVDLSVGDRKYK